MEEPENADGPLRVIGRYALYGKLAVGGMAAVHFGRLLGPAGFSRTVAIKRLHAQYAKDPEFVAMFLDEARLAARIQHPNVVATVDVVALEDELFLVMDYVRGESFSRLLRASRKKSIDVPIGIIGGVIAGMLHGLHAAHEAKDEQGRPLAVVHRDVSPQNVLVGVDGAPRVLDFGVAKAAARVQVTRDGQMKGKLAYMAPEQLKAQGVDRRTDVFAAGIVLWEALTGRRLFDAEEASEVLRMILSEDIPPPSAVVPSIPRNVDAAVMKALTRDPKGRYQTAREFAIALEETMHLASPREIGEWVERVAGETLLRREQALAEIEAVSDVSLITDSAPGFMKTLDGISSAAKRPVAPGKEPDDVSQWDEGPTTTFDPARVNPNDLATRLDGLTTRRGGPDPLAPRAPSVGDASKAAVRRGPPTTRLGLGSAKPATSPVPATPHPGSNSSVRTVAAPKPNRSSVAPVRPAARRGAAPPTSEPRMFPPPSEPPPAFSGDLVRSPAASSRTSPPGFRGGSTPPANSSGDLVRSPAAAPPTASGFDDENEATHVFDQDRHAIGDKNAEDEATRVFDKDRRGFDDENETTHVFDKEHHGPRQLPIKPGTTKIGLGVPKEPPPRVAVPAVPAAPAVPKERSERPGQKTIRIERPTSKPAPPPQTVIVQEHTDPAIFRSGSLWWRTARWFWDDPTQRGVRVGAVAGVVVFFAVFFAASGHGGKNVRAPRPATSEVAEEARQPNPPAPALTEEPHGVDPTTLPRAVEEPADDGAAERKEKQKHAGHAATPAEDRVATADPSPPVTRGTPAPSTPADPAPTPTPKPVVSPDAPANPAAADDDLESPYAAPKKSTSSAPKAAPKPKKSASAADCSQPFTVDENGIKRIKPQCL